MATYFSSLRFKLIILVFLSVLPICCLVSYKSIQDSWDDLEDSKAQAIRLAYLSASSVSQVIDQAHLRSAIDVELPQESVIFICDDQGIELARNPKNETYAGHKCPWWAEKQEGKFIEKTGIDGIDRLYTYIQVRNNSKLFIGVGLSKRVVISESRRVLYLSLIWLAISVACTAIIAWYFAEKIVVEDIKVLLDNTQLIASGNWKIKTQHTCKSWEFRQLALSFNEMAQNLKQSISLLEANEDNLENIVANRTKELQQANEELLNSNEELQKFAYIASHDLKAPLRAVSNLSGWIVEDVKEGKDVTKYVEKMLGRIKRMEDLINGLLEYSRIGRVHVESELIDANDIIRKLKEDYPETAHQVIVETPLPVINFNRVRIGQVFANLIGNAFKHHHDMTHALINISCKEVGEDYVFCVEDNGPGIEGRFHEKIFEMFQTLKPRDELESTGIGLAIVKKIIEDYNGCIWLESFIGEGSKFYFSIRK